MTFISAALAKKLSNDRMTIATIIAALGVARMVCFRRVKRRTGLRQRDGAGIAYYVRTVKLAVSILGQCRAPHNIPFTHQTFSANWAAGLSSANSTVIVSFPGTSFASAIGRLDALGILSESRGR
jgi:hypothetical protein